MRDGRASNTGDDELSTQADVARRCTGPAHHGGEGVEMRGGAKLMM